MRNIFKFLSYDIFIRTNKKNRSSSKLFECQQLVESVRTEKTVRQKLLLSFGRLPLVNDNWLQLAKRIKSIIQGQESLFQETSDIEELANKFAKHLIEKQTLVTGFDKLQTVDLQSLQNFRVRRIGSEYPGVTFFSKLQLVKCLKGCAFSKRQIKIAISRGRKRRSGLPH